MPVRKVPKSYRNVTGIAAHRKAVGQAMFESPLERDFLILLEFDPTLDDFEVQPVRIDWIDPVGKARHYTPDVLATFNVNGHRNKILYEVKCRDELRQDWNELRPKFRAAVYFARSHRWRFKIMTEVEIRTPYLESARFLLPFVRSGPVEAAHMDLLDEALKTLKQSTPSELLGSVFKDEWNQARLLPSLWYLVGSRQIGIDLESKITMSSPIWSLCR